MLQTPFAAFENPLIIGVVFTFLSIIPMGLLSVTSYLKISVILGILRNALGAGQIPGPAVTSLLSMVLTFYIMTPVGKEIIKLAENNGTMSLFISSQKLVKTNKKSFSVDFIELTEKLETTLEPLKKFLEQYAGEKEVVFFAKQKLKHQKILLSEEEIRRNSKKFSTLIPAFVLTQLTEAFAIGFSIFLPFLVIDLVISNLLIAMGMSMVNPITITVPLKLLLFVLCDGWFVLSRALVLQYGG